MIAVFAMAQLLSIISVLYLEYRNGSVAVFLWATLLVMFGLPHFIGVLFTESMYPSSVMLQASMFTLAFNVVYLVVRIIPLGRRRTHPLFSEFRLPPPSNNRDIRITQVLIGLFLLALLLSLATIVAVSNSRYGGVLNTSWGEFFTSSASVYDLHLDSGAALLAVKYLVFASGGVIVPLWYNKKYTLSLLAASSNICYSLITRNRITILPVFVSILLIYISRNRKIRTSQVITLSVLGLIVIYTVYAIRVFRHFGTIADFLANFDLKYMNSRILEMVATGNGELGLRDAFYHFIYFNNDFPNFGKLHTYLRLLLIALPTGYSFGLKPPDFAITMGSAYMGDFGNTIVSMHPTLYGDCYANLGWLGVSLGVYWALVVSWIDRLVHRTNTILRAAFIVLFGCVYVIMGRGSVYNGAYIGFISGIFLIVAEFLVTRIRYDMRFPRSTVRHVTRTPF